MWQRIIGWLGFGALLVVVSAEAAVQAPVLGNGLTGVTDWTTERPFKDIFKYSRSWLTQCDYGVQGCTNGFDTGEQALLDLDAHGWVRSLPAPADAPEYWKVATHWALDASFPTGRYLVLYDGEGTLQYFGGATQVTGESVPGRHVIDIHTPANGLSLVIAATDPNGTGEYVRNIRVIPEQYEGDYLAQPFHPDFLARVQPFHVQRFMDWMDTNYSTQSAWADRPLLDDARYTESGGVPAEVMIDLVNTLDQHAWFNIPHQADDQYVREFARLALQRLDTDQRVYLEYSNEVWNGQFTQATWIGQQADAAWPGVATPFERRLSWYGKRTAEVCQIWKQEWGSASGRVVCVMGAQAANSWTSQQALNCPQWAQGPCVGYGIDALAVAPYFGGYLGDPGNATTVGGWTQDADGGLTALFQELEWGGAILGAGALDQSFAWMDAQYQVAASMGLELLAYEGGQHLVGHGGVENDNAITQLFIAANRDARMGGLYATYLDEWRRRGGGLFMHFVGISSPSKWGSWGALEHAAQTGSPKYDALLAYLASGDSDGDGMADDWERLYGLDPNADDSAVDSDGDGYDNLTEYLGAARPDRAGDVPPDGGCSGAGDVLVQDRRFTAPALVRCEAGGELRTSGAVEATAGVSVTFRAGQIVFGPGFRSGGGAIDAAPW